MVSIRRWVNYCCAVSRGAFGSGVRCRWGGRDGHGGNPIGGCTLTAFALRSEHPRPVVSSTFGAQPHFSSSSHSCFSHSCAPSGGSQSPAGLICAELQCSGLRRRSARGSVWPLVCRELGVQEGLPQCVLPPGCSLRAVQPQEPAGAVSHYLGSASRPCHLPLLAHQ